MLSKDTTWIIEILHRIDCIADENWPQGDTVDMKILISVC